MSKKKSNFAQNFVRMSEFISTGDFYEAPDACFRYKYARASLTADKVNFSVVGHDLYVLLIRRKDDADSEPGKWAIPGGFMRVYPTAEDIEKANSESLQGDSLRTFIGERIDDSIESCANRELREETNFIDSNDDAPKLVDVFSKVGRDGRGRVVTVAYYKLVQQSEVVGDDDASEARWWPVKDLPIDDELAFDHKLIIQASLKRLRSDFQFDSATFKLLPEKFTILQLFELYYAVYSDQLGSYEDFYKTQRSNFYTQVKKLGILIPAFEKEDEPTKKAPGVSREKFRFYEARYKELLEQKRKNYGVHFFNLIGRK